MRFDTDGSALRVGETKLTARGRDAKDYQSPFGVVRVERYVYQSWRGGRIYCPLERQARIIRGATPRFASQISHKYAQLKAGAVQRDLEQNHGRAVAKSYIQHVGEWVGHIAMAKEEDWEYEMPKLAGVVETVMVSLDGAMIPMADSVGYREAMVGTLSFYDPEGERQHTIYLAASPEYGKHAFYQRMTREIDRAKQRYPDALYLGIADGAASNWSFLEEHTERQLIDFFHVSEYVATLAQAPSATLGRGATLALAPSAVPRSQGRSQCGEPADRRSGHALAAHRPLAGTSRQRLQRLDLFQQSSPSDGLPRFPAESLPIGSGVTEAACKTLVKQRLCASGMRWKTQGAKIILSLRALVHTTERWTQFWEKIDQFGAECCC